jgi:NADPH:quinone reductase-like Zn-dependent oxidoreductase
MVDTGQIRPEVSQVLQLKDIRHAHQMLETHHTRGKIVLVDGH